QILDVLDPDAQTHQAVIDAARHANLCGDAGVSHGRGMTDERFDSAQAFREAEELRARQKAQCSFLAALYADTDHASEIAHLLLGEFMAWMTGQSRIVDALHLRLLHQPIGQSTSVGAMAIHPNG